MSARKLWVLNAGQNFHVRGGSDRYQLDLSSLLTEHGHTVVPFAAADPRNIETPWKKFFPRRVNFERPSIFDAARFIYSPDAKRKLSSLLKSAPIDIAHLHIYYGQLTSSILGELSRHQIPIVQTLHEYKLVCPVYTLTRKGNFCRECSQQQYWHCLRYRCNRGSFKRSLLSTLESYISLALGSHEKVQKFICVSEFQKSTIAAMGISATKLTAVHNFVRAEKLRSTAGSGEYVLYFGRIEPVKGIYTLLEACADLPQIPLLIVGDGGSRSDVEALIQRRRLSHVKVLGHKTGAELSDLVSNCRFSVVPSVWPETFGLTILETYAKGRPVVASRIGGMPEVVDDGIDGLLFEPGNHLELAALIKDLWSSPELAIRMGKRGQTKARTVFGPEQHYQRVVDVYHSVL